VHSDESPTSSPRPLSAYSLLRQGSRNGAPGAPHSWPRRIASHRVASRRIASHRVASRRVASHRVALRRMRTLCSQGLFIHVCFLQNMLILCFIPPTVPLHYSHISHGKFCSLCRTLSFFLAEYSPTQNCFRNSLASLG
jgi:hypothetical protein